jgi:hypothetical protein
MGLMLVGNGGKCIEKLEVLDVLLALNVWCANWFLSVVDFFIWL